MKSEHLHILQHSLGLDKYGRGSQYRNRYVCDQNPEMEELVTLKLMVDHGVMSMCGGMHCYSVTDYGINQMLIASPVHPKVSRSKQRYQEFLRSDCGYSFREWLGIRTS